MVNIVQFCNKYSSYKCGGIGTIREIQRLSETVRFSLFYEFHGSDADRGSWGETGLFISLYEFVQFLWKLAK